MNTGMEALTDTGQRLEAAALLRNTRFSLSTAFDQLRDLNTVEADELARVVTELRRSAERIEQNES